MSNSEIENLNFKIKQDTIKKIGKAVGFYDYFKYRVAYDMVMELDLIFIFVTELMDDFFGLTKIELTTFKKEFFKLFGDHLKNKNFDFSQLEALNPIIDGMHKNIKPKIAVVGFSGVGKTTIKNLIKQDEIPLLHVPTISGEITTIKIDKLEFNLFDFAGQDQFKYLWKGFIAESNAVLIITDSTPLNVENSRFFLNLCNKEVPYAHRAIVGNKQDLPNAMKVEEIENVLGLKTYPMMANRSENRDKMIKIIAEILDMEMESSPLLGDMLKQKSPMDKNQNLIMANHIKASKYDSQSIIFEPEKSLDFIEINRTNVGLALDLCNQIVEEIKGLKLDSILKDHYKMISSTLRKLNSNMDLKYEDFVKFYDDYLNKNLMCKIPSLKQFLESEFSLLIKTIEVDEKKTSKSNDDMSIVINALICTFLTLINPDKFSDFDSISNYFKLDLFNANAINEIHAYYLKILNKFNP